ncbi:MAG: precorrin-8X methylmutase [Thermodesulfobacteriota bacterium]
MAQIKKNIENNTGVLLLGHGSRVGEANDPLREVAASIEGKGLFSGVCEPAFLEFEKPNFAEAAEILAEKGVNEIVVMPYFLYTGNHVRRDLPREMNAAKERYPEISFTLAGNLGYHSSLVDITLERINAASNGNGADSKPAAAPRPPEIHPIEKKSFSIISSEMDEESFSPIELPIIKRVIHTTADYDFASIIKFSPGAIAAAVKALGEGCSIITDVRMIESGISRERLSALGDGRVYCFSSDPDVKSLAESEDITKTAASMRKAASHLGGAIAVIGNAPTALREILSLIGAGKIKPALVIGVPVGFVGAREAKEELMASSDIEYIATEGRKGGSTVAVAIVNALLIEAGKEALN